VENGIKTQWRIKSLIQYTNNDNNEEIKYNATDNEV
jgi:hypothetical protein